MSNTAGRKWEMRHIYIYSTNSIPKTRKTGNHWRTQNQKSVTKYSAPKAQKRYVAKTTNIKNRLEIAQYSSS